MYYLQTVLKRYEFESLDKALNKALNLITGKETEIDGDLCSIFQLKEYAWDTKYVDVSIIELYRGYDEVQIVGKHGFLEIYTVEEAIEFLQQRLKK